MFTKAFVSRVFILVLVLALAACGPGEAPAVSDVETPEPGSVSAPLSEEPTEAVPTDLPEPTSTTEPTATPEPEATATPEGTQCLTTGEIVEVISTGMGITGQGIIQVVVRNPTGEEITVRLEPGCYFAPPAGADQQRMMVLQAVEVALAPDETTTIDPYVACIDSDAGAPEEAAGYTVGEMVPDSNLQALAQCLDGQDLPADAMDFDAILGLQMAIWQVSDGYSLDEYMEEWVAAEDEMGEELGSEMGDMMDAIMPMMQGMMDSANVWLDACGVEPTGEE